MLELKFSLFQTFCPIMKACTLFLAREQFHQWSQWYFITRHFAGSWGKKKTWLLKPGRCQPSTFRYCFIASHSGVNYLWQQNSITGSTAKKTNQKKTVIKIIFIIKTNSGYPLLQVRSWWGDRWLCIGRRMGAWVQVPVHIWRAHAFRTPQQTAWEVVGKQRTEHVEKVLP